MELTYLTNTTISNRFQRSQGVGGTRLQLYGCILVSYMEILQRFCTDQCPLAIDWPLDWRKRDVVSQICTGMVGMSTVIVTGAASGIGRATVDHLQENGEYDRIVALDIDEAITEMFDSPVVPHVVDVANYESVEATVTALEEDGVIEAIANCAGISQAGWVDEISSADWDRVIDVNLKGPFNFARAAGPAMYERDRGSIVTVSSGAGQRGSLTGGVHYSASKAGLFGLTRGLAKQLGPAVRVNCVVPGLIETPLATESGLWEDGEIAEFESSIPLQRIGQPEEVAESIAFLLGDQSSYVTGSLLTVDGGAQLS